MDNQMQPSATTDMPDRRKELKGTPKRVWAYLLKYAIAYGGRLPTLREICQALGIASTNTASYNMRKLMDLGLVGKDDAGYYIEGAIFIPPPFYATAAHEEILLSAFGAGDLAELMKTFATYDARLIAVEMASAQREALMRRLVAGLPFLIGAAADVRNGEN